MATMASAFPILPGKTADWKRFTEEVTTTRRDEVIDFHRRFGFTRVNWFLQQTPMGDLFILWVEAEDPTRSLMQWMASDHPFDRWFKEQAGSYYGLDLNQPPPGPLPQLVFEWQAR